MKKMTSVEFKKDNLEMLKVLADFCEKNNLKYILDYGTLLGCIRHKGFIPWDDDIDVSMPRKDYNKLYKLLKERDFSFTENYKLSHYSNKYSCQKPYINIVDITTITHDNVRKDKYFYPVWLDVFPVDKTNGKMFVDKLVNVFNGLARMPIWNTQSIVKKVFQVVLKPFMKMNFYVSDKFRRVFNKRNYSKLHYFNSTLKTKDINYQSYFEDFIYGEFENCKFRIPKDYDVRLKCLYGDYMTLPPKEKRTGHVNDAYHL